MRLARRNHLMATWMLQLLSRLQCVCFPTNSPNVQETNKQKTQKTNVGMKNVPLWEELPEGVTLSPRDEYLFMNKRDDYFPPIEGESISEHNMAYFDFDSDCLGSCVGNYCRKSNDFTHLAIARGIANGESGFGEDGGRSITRIRKPPTW